MIVVDASAFLETVVADPPDADLLLRLAEVELHAPHLVDIEVLHALRTLVIRRSGTPQRVEAARTAYMSLNVTRYSHVLLADRVWDLRGNLSAYDAAYVALAEALEVPLVTTDARIARAPNLRTTVEVFDRTP